MKYFAPLGIFVRQGRRTQDAGRRATKITGGLLHLFTVTIIRFSLHRPFKKKGYSPPLIYVSASLDIKNFTASELLFHIALAREVTP